MWRAMSRRSSVRCARCLESSHGIPGQRSLPLAWRLDASPEDTSANSSSNRCRHTGLVDASPDHFPGNERGEAHVGVNAMRWSKQGFETDAEYRAFTNWLYCPSRPSDPCHPIAMRNDWRSRAAAYDEEHRPPAVESQQHQERALRATALQIARREMDRLLEQIADKPGTDLGFFKPRDLLALATFATGQRETSTTSADDDVDLSSLTDAELDKLAALPRRARQ